MLIRIIINADEIFAFPNDRSKLPFQDEFCPSGLPGQLEDRCGRAGNRSPRGPAKESGVNL